MGPFGAHLGPIWGPLALGPFGACLGPRSGPVWGPFGPWAAKKQKINFLLPIQAWPWKGALSESVAGDLVHWIIYMLIDS